MGETSAVNASGLTEHERQLVLDALRSPRGRYSASRASQLSGVPERTVYEWALRDVLVPDYRNASPKQWSYRDLVYLRLLVWLRSKGMERAQATREVAEIRRRANAGDLPTLTLRADRQVLIVDPEQSDGLTGVTPLDVGLLIETFDLAEPVDDIGRVWGPNLVRPSAHTYISPWVMGGDPVITDTRVSSASVFALRTERRLSAAKIAALYPGLTEESIEDAVSFERRVRETDPKIRRAEVAAV